jgi:toxin ParE1/3/4
VARVSWTDQGWDDLDSICLFIARDSPRFSEVVAQRIFQTTQRLADFPRMGRIVPEIGQSHIREVLVHGYRIIYRLLEDEVEIITIHHGARPLEGIEPANDP